MASRPLTENKDGSTSCCFGIWSDVILQTENLYPRTLTHFTLHPWSENDYRPQYTLYNSVFTTAHCYISRMDLNPTQEYRGTDNKQ